MCTAGLPLFPPPADGALAKQYLRDNGAGEDKSVIKEAYKSHPHPENDYDPAQGDALEVRALPQGSCARGVAPRPPSAAHGCGAPPALCCARGVGAATGQLRAAVGAARAVVTPPHACLL